MFSKLFLEDLPLLYSKENSLNFINQQSQETKKVGSAHFPHRARQMCQKYSMSFSSWQNLFGEK